MNAKEKLRGRVVMLNNLLKRPVTYWADSTDSPNVANVGHLALEYNSSYPKPYRLVETGGERAWGERMSAGEMNLYLDGIVHGITLQISKQNATTTVWGEEVSVVYKPTAEV